MIQPGKRQPGDHLKRMQHFKMSKKTKLGRLLQPVCAGFIGRFTKKLFGEVVYFPSYLSFEICFLKIESRNYQISIIHISQSNRFKSIGALFAKFPKYLQYFLNAFLYNIHKVNVSQTFAQQI